MPDELVDIVDDNDNIIGQGMKSKCHAEGILHRGVALLVFKDDTFKEILITQRSLKKDMNPGKFCFPGGHVANGEEYKKAIKREYFEEVYNSKEPVKDLKFERLLKSQNTPAF